MTVKYVFDVHPEDRFACMADVGWITGHTYIVYGPLALGVTTTFFESTPVYPNAGRYWDFVDEHKITQFYTAPTVSLAVACRKFLHELTIVSTFSCHRPFDFCDDSARTLSRSTTCQLCESLDPSVNPSTRKLGTGTTTMSDEAKPPLSTPTG